MPRIDDMIACLSRRVMMMLVIVAMIVMVMVMVMMVRTAVCMVVMVMILRMMLGMTVRGLFVGRNPAGTPRQFRNKRSNWVVSR